MFAFLAKLFRVAAPAAPAPAAPVVSAPVAPILPPLDSRDWVQEHPGWSWTDARIDYAGSAHSGLMSPHRPIPTSRRVTVACTMAGEAWGPFMAKGLVTVSAYNDKGGHVYSTHGDPVNAGGFVAEAEFPDSAAYYVIRLYAFISYEGGTDDTRLLPMRFVNLGASDA